MADDPAPSRDLRVSVVVPHYNDPAALDRCLASLAAQTFPADAFEVVVADNRSPQGEAEIARAIAGRARLVIAEDRGAGPARNAGVAQTRAPLLAFIDSDCVAEPQWLAAGTAALERADFVGGRMVVPDTDGGKSGAEAFEQVFAFDNRRYVEKLGFTVTANLFCPRALYDRVGGFRVGVSEDLEWCHRARDLGFRIGYAPDAVVAHPARPDWPALVTKWRRINAESYALVSGTARGRLGWLAKTWALPASILAHAPRVLRSSRLATPAERTAALATLARLRLWRFVDAHRLLVRPR